MVERDRGSPLGIVSALPREAQSLDAHFDRSAVREIAGCRFWPGRIDGHGVIMVEAGVGKVATATVASLLLDRFACRGLIFTGVAGGLDAALAIGDIVVADELIQHDYGALVAGRLKSYRPGLAPIGESSEPLSFRLDPRLRSQVAEALAGLQLPPFAGAGNSSRPARVLLGRILSGDQFVNCSSTRERLVEEFHGLAVEMEGAALAQVAERFGVPCIVVRCLSDLAGLDSHIDFTSFLPAAADAAASVVRRLIPVLAAA
jgi:adenosylhomocysteine nucleosidase